MKGPMEVLVIVTSHWVATEKPLIIVKFGIDEYLEIYCFQLSRTLIFMYTLIS